MPGGSVANDVENGPETGDGMGGLDGASLLRGTSTDCDGYGVGFITGIMAPHKGIRTTVTAMTPMTEPSKHR